MDWNRECQVSNTMKGKKCLQLNPGIVVQGSNNDKEIIDMEISVSPILQQSGNLPPMPPKDLQNPPLHIMR